MTDNEIIDWLWKYGHFRNPEIVDTHNIQESDLGILTLENRVVKDAIRSIQMLDANFELLSQQHHNRVAQFDGEVGPATRELLTLPRCGSPDYQAATGEGSWPVPGCDPTRPNRETEHSIRVALNTSNASSKVKAYLEESLQMVRDAYGEMGLSVRYILDGSTDVEIVKRFQRLGGSTIGWNHILQRSTCNQTLEGRLDSGYQPDAQLFAVLECHETGHGVGAGHTRGGIMNPSILRVSPLTWRGDPSESKMARWFGGEPIDDEPTPPTPVQNPPLTGTIYGEEFEQDRYAIRGELTLELTDEKPGDYVYIIEPVPGSPNRFRTVQKPDTGGQ
jgi:hypothetical protein